MTEAYRIVASDLDGTLLNSQGKLSAENEQAMQALTEKGVFFVPSSGRTLEEIPLFIRENPSVRYIIHSDGAAVYDKQTGERIDLSMSQESARTVLDILAEYETNMTVRHLGKSYVDERMFNDEAGRYYRLQDDFQQYIYDYSIPVTNFDLFCRSLDSIEMICVFFHDQAEQDACRDRLLKLGAYGVAASEPTNLEIFDKNAGKGSALLRLAEHLGVDRSQTIAVGDSPNDLDMLSKAGLGLAMGNAAPEIQAMADAVACRNDEHVVSYILHTYIH